MPKHAEAIPQRGLLRRVRTLAVSALGAAGLLALALAGVGGTYALWNDGAELESAVITTGTAELTASWGDWHAAGSPAQWSDLLPGESVRRGFDLTNSGDVDLEVSATAVSGASFEVRASPGPCGADPLDGNSLGDDPGALGVVAAGASSEGCLEVRLAETATPGESLEFEVRFDGRQVAP